VRWSREACDGGCGVALDEPEGHDDRGEGEGEGEDEADSEGDEVVGAGPGDHIGVVDSADHGPGYEEAESDGD
jgi:hypothetical protein